MALLAVALCADRAAIGAPSHRPALSEACRSIAAKLAMPLRQTSPQIHLERNLRVAPVASQSLPLIDVALRPIQRLELPLMLYRLPPPLA